MSLQPTSVRHELIGRAIIITDHGILVNRGRNAKTGEEYFALPGGHIDPGESAQDAVRRELEEELQAVVTVGDLQFVSESVYAGRHHDDGRRQEIVLYFGADLQGELHQVDGLISSPEPDKKFQWLPYTQLAEANMLPQAIKTFLLSEAATRARYEFRDDT